MNRGLQGYPRGLAPLHPRVFKSPLGVRPRTARVPWTVPVSGYVGWWDAADYASVQLSGTDVVNWRDKSGNQNDFVPGTAPTVSNDRKIHRYTCPEFIPASSHHLKMKDVNTGIDPETTPQNQRTRFCVALLDDMSVTYRAMLAGWWTNAFQMRVKDVSGTYRLETGRQEGAGWTHDTASITLGTPFLAIQRIDYVADVVTHWLNGIREEKSLGYSFPSFSLYAGRGVNAVPDYQWDGLMGEIIVYERVLADVEVQKVMSYLRSKWSVA